MYNYEDLLLVPFSKMTCWPLCREVARRAGRSLPFYESWIENLTLRDKTIRSKAGDFEELHEPEPFCLVVFRGREGLRHIGIVLECCKKFIHTTRQMGHPMITRLDDEVWKRKIFGFYRYVADSKD